MEPVQIGDDYRVERKLASGGFGTVYLATQLSLDRYVCVKRIHPHMMGHAEVDTVAMFLDEARLVAKLRHENVCRVIDCQRAAEGVPVIVMDYIEGCDVQTLLERHGPLPWRSVAYILIEVLKALVEAHEPDPSTGRPALIHRDIKGGNLMLSNRGMVAVGDFGIARPAHHERCLWLPALPGRRVRQTGAEYIEIEIRVDASLLRVDQRRPAVLDCSERGERTERLIHGLQYDLGLDARGHLGPLRSGRSGGTVCPNPVGAGREPRGGGCPADRPPVHTHIAGLSARLPNDAMCPGGTDDECPEGGICRTVGTFANRCTDECTIASERSTPPVAGSTCGDGSSSTGPDYCGS